MALEKYIFKNKTALKCAQDVVDALNSSSDFLLSEKLEKGIALSESIAIIFNPPEKETLIRKKRFIRDINCYYNFQNIRDNNNFEFFSTIFSNQTELIPVDSSIEEQTFLFTNSTKPEDNKIVKISNEQRSETIQYLEDKRMMINMISRNNVTLDNGSIFN